MFSSAPCATYFSNHSRVLTATVRGQSWSSSAVESRVIAPSALTSHPFGPAVTSPLSESSSEPFESEICPIVSAKGSSLSRRSARTSEKATGSGIMSPGWAENSVILSWPTISRGRPRAVP
jgi:hypothetical protein